MKTKVIITVAFLILLLVFEYCFGAPLYNSFNSGELTPRLRYRVELDKRRMGAGTLENFVVKQQGAAVRRPGTKYVATVSTPSF